MNQIKTSSVDILWKWNYSTAKLCLRYNLFERSCNFYTQIDPNMPRILATLQLTKLPNMFIWTRIWKSFLIHIRYHCIAFFKNKSATFLNKLHIPRFVSSSRSYVKRYHMVTLGKPGITIRSAAYTKSHHIFFWCGRLLSLYGEMRSWFKKLIP